MIERKQTPDGDTLLYQGKYLYSSLYPKKKASQAVAKLDKHHCLYVIISPLLGYGIAESLAHLADTSIVLLLEFDNDLDKCTAAYLKEGGARVRYLSNPDAYAVESYLKESEFFAIEEVELRYPSAGFSLHEGEYQEFTQQINVLVERERMNRYMLQRMRQRWLKNTLSNISHKLQTYQALPRVDRPIIVIGAGVTLEDYRQWLLERVSDYYIIVVDTALPVIHSYGIKPDLILALESSVINLLDFIGVAYSDVVMLCDLSAHPQSQRAHHGKTLHIQSVVSQASLYQRLADKLPLATIMAGGSVGISAIVMALQMTNDAIILCGIDFAYIPGKSHAKGAYTHALQLATWHRFSGIPLLTETLERPLVMAKNQYQKPIFSDEVLLSYAQMLINTSIKRIFALPSAHSLAMNLPLWSDPSIPSLPKIPLKWISRVYTRNAVKDFIRHEIEYLEAFLLGDDGAWAYVDYLFLGEAYNLSISKTDEARERAREMIIWWQGVL